jgi:hypothetical protein
MGMPSRDEMAAVLAEQGRLLRLGPLAPVEHWALLSDDLDRLNEQIAESEALGLTELMVHQVVAAEARHRLRTLTAADGGADGLAGFAVGGGL